MRLIDTHCHLDADEFDADRDDVLRRADVSGVDAIVVPAVDRHNWQRVLQLADASVVSARGPRIHFALGIHPLCVDGSAEADLQALLECVERHRAHPRFAGIGEIGLDHFVPGLDRQKQGRYLDAQLRMARDLDCPVILHTRRSVDQVGAALRRFRPCSGIAHAFNGSEQQARALLDLNMALGFGGAMTFERARNIRRLAAQVPDDAFVLETDAPDIPPAWLGQGGGGGAGAAPVDDPLRRARLRNEPGEVSRIAGVMATLRGISRERVLALSAANAQRMLPGLAGPDTSLSGAAPPTPCPEP